MSYRYILIVKCKANLTFTQVKREMAKNRQLLEDKIWNITKSSPVLREENWTADVMAEMKKFEKEIVTAMKVRQYFPGRQIANQSVGKRVGWTRRPGEEKMDFSWLFVLLHSADQYYWIWRSDS